MPDGCFEIPLEIYFKFRETSPEQKKTWHEPGHGAEFEIDTIEVEEHNIEKIVHEYIRDNYSDLMEQDAPDPDEAYDNARMEDD